jgi:hypothetical protein
MSNKNKQNHSPSPSSSDSDSFSPLQEIQVIDYNKFKQDIDHKNIEKSNYDYKKFIRNLYIEEFKKFN